jgi:hypothetical protein
MFQCGYNNMDQHTLCGHRCPCCFNVQPCRVEGNMLFCIECRRWFANKECITSHKVVRTQNVSKDGDAVSVQSSTCADIHRCTDCGKTLHLRRKKKDQVWITFHHFISFHHNSSSSNMHQEHKCGESECKTCKMMVDTNDHLCYTQPIVTEQGRGKKQKKEEMTPQTFWFYDFEVRYADMVYLHRYFYFRITSFQSSQDQTMGETSEGLVLKHVVNLVCVRKCCDLCYEEPGEFVCKNCGHRRIMFSGKTALDDFCKALFCKKNKDIIAMAHNAGGELMLFFLIFSSC